MKTTASLKFYAGAVSTILTACGANRSSETVTTDSTTSLASQNSAGATAQKSSNTLSTGSITISNSQTCNSVDLSRVSSTEKHKFFAAIPAMCKGKSALLLVKYPSATFPAVEGLNCLLLRSADEFQKYGDFTFRCSGPAVAFPAGAGVYAIEIPAVKGLDPAALKFRLIVE